MSKSLLKRVATGVATSAAVLGLMASAAGTAQAATPRATLKAAAIQVVTERQGGEFYGKYKAKYPNELNWTNDGCSVPNELIVASPALFGVLKAYGNVFEHSCDRHDFGYRNFGKNTSTPGVHPKFEPTRARKDQIDAQFYWNMKYQCDRKYTIGEAPCKAAAKVFYEAVSRFGDKAFFG